MSIPETIGVEPIDCKLRACHSGPGVTKGKEYFGVQYNHAILIQDDDANNVFYGMDQVVNRFDSMEIGRVEDGKWRMIVGDPKKTY